MDLANVIVKGAITAGGLCLFFWCCIAIWEFITSSFRAAAKKVSEKLPDAMEQTAHIAGKAIADASSLGKKLKKSFDEGRSNKP